MTNPTPTPTVMNVVIIIVVLVWAASILLEAFVKSYDPPSGVNEVFMIVAGFLFGVRGKMNGKAA